MGEGFGILMLLGVALGVLLVVCWIVLPIAIIGTKPLLRELIAEQQHTNKLLAQLGQLLDAEHGNDSARVTGGTPRK